MHCYNDTVLACLVLVLMQEREVAPGHQLPAWGGSGHCLLFGSQNSQNSQTPLAPRQIEFR